MNHHPFIPPLLSVQSSKGTKETLVQMLYCVWDVSNGVRNVNLTIVPSTVNLSGSAVLYCGYDLEGAPLYTVKWYRGESEFYRYTDTEENKIQVFEIDGFALDEERSNSTQAYLRNISDFKHSGNFTCEVTDYGQPISTGRDMRTMLVVQLPSSPPVISVTHKPFDYDDVLRANCSSPPSRPQAILRMSLNKIVIGRTDMTLAQKSQEPVWSDLNVEITISEFFFKQAGERLILECVAQVAGYESNAVLELASARHPVPERVRAFGSSSSNVVAACTSTMQLITLILMFFVNNNS
ncbi:hypothetical protein QE152_g13410 [Popillia japonica]|uniref:Ig-like domain-containing protein n=1 Tax=Popillia japonica TaxID=7064 RepID=A0AAW1L9L0_POPJA